MVYQFGVQTAKFLLIVLSMLLLRLPWVFLGVFLAGTIALAAYTLSHQVGMGPQNLFGRSLEEWSCNGPSMRRPKESAAHQPLRSLCMILLMPGAFWYAGLYHPCRGAAACGGVCGGGMGRDRGNGGVSSPHV